MIYCKQLCHLRGLNKMKVGLDDMLGQAEAQMVQGLLSHIEGVGGDAVVRHPPGPIDLVADVLLVPKSHHKAPLLLKVGDPGELVRNLFLETPLLQTGPTLALEHVILQELVLPLLTLHCPVVHPVIAHGDLLPMVNVPVGDED